MPFTKHLIALPALIAVLFLSPAQAANQQALANVKGCFACHDRDSQKIGPSYTAIAGKYAGQKGAVDKLVKKVLEGGVGVWGEVPEPANKTMGVTEKDARKLVTWILSQKPVKADAKK